jgi:DNA-binding beta-propeller fold protein YncE
VAAAPDGTLYIAEYPHRILHYDAAGTFLGAWGSEGTGAGQFLTPYGVAVAPDGTVYVADFYNNRIQAFDADGTYLGQWGNFGTGEGEFDRPGGVAVAPDGRTVYVGDTFNNRVQVFCVTPGAAGERQRATPGAGTPAPPVRRPRQ